MGESINELPQSLPTPSVTEIIAHLRDVCLSETFSRSSQGKKLLRYLVNAAIRNEGRGAFKGTIVGIEVFGLPPGHDPTQTSTVRVSICALRESLARFYDTEGSGLAVRIKIPERTYKPSFEYFGAAVSNLDGSATMYVANAKSLMNQRTLPGYRQALRYLDLALARHPNHPRILSLSAMVYAASALYGERPQNAFESARTLVDRARQHGHEPWELPLVDAWITMHVDFDWLRADKLFEHAMTLNPSEVKQHTWYHAFLASQLRWAEFLSLVEDTASGAEYDSDYFRGRLALAQIVSGNLDAAAETLRGTFEVFPHNHYTTYLHLAVLEEATGNYRGAARVFDKLQQSTGLTTIGAGLEILVRGLSGDRKRAREMYASLLAARSAENSFIPALQLGLACIGLGDIKGAAQWVVEACLHEHDPTLSWLGIMPTMRHLRIEPEFNSLVEQRLKLKFRD